MIAGQFQPELVRRLEPERKRLYSDKAHCQGAKVFTSSEPIIGLNMRPAIAEAEPTWRASGVIRNLTAQSPGSA